MAFCKHRVMDKCKKDNMPCIFSKECCEPEEKKTTNADRIRNMNIAGLKIFIERAIYCGGLISEEKSSSLCRGCQYPFCQDIEAWLQAEVKEGE